MPREPESRPSPRSPKDSWRSRAAAAIRPGRRFGIVILPAIGGVAAGYPQGGWWAAAGGSAGAVSGWLAERGLERSDDRVKNQAARAEVLASLLPAHQSIADRGVFELLVATRRILPLQGRRRDLRQLSAWCLDVASHPVMLVSGEGGVGKTRLAVELALSLNDTWATGWLIRNKGRTAGEAISACKEQTLVLVDEADTHVDLADFLESINRSSSQPVIRVLLLTRDPAGVQASLARKLADDARWLSNGPSMLIQTVGKASDRLRWFQRAYQAFAAERSTAVAAVVGEESYSAKLDEPIQMIQARALLAVLEVESRTISKSVADLTKDEVIAGLLSHEAAWWDGTATVSDWGVASLVPATRERGLVILTLLGAESLAAAIDALRRLPEFTDAPALALTNLTRWAAHLYPPNSGHAPEMRPDLLADWFVAHHLSRSTDLSSALAPLSPDQRLRALTRLARVVTYDSGLAGLFVEVVRANMSEETLKVAVEATLSSGPESVLLDTELSAMAGEVDSPASTASLIDEKIPPHRLPRLRTTLAEFLLADAEARRQPLDIVHACAAMGSRLPAVGRDTEAVAVSAKGLVLLRGLVTAGEAEPRHLADALTDRASLMRRLDKVVEAEGSAAEAVELWRGLPESDAVTQRGLAASLVELCRWPRVSPDIGEAEDAVELWRRLAEDDPGCRPGLGAALTILGSRLYEVSRSTDAEEILNESVDLWRGLVGESDLHLLGLTDALRNIAELRIGRKARSGKEAANAGIDELDEAARLLRQIVRVDESRLRELGYTLDAYSARLDHLGYPTRAVDVGVEALGVWQKLIQRDSRYSENYVSYSTNLPGALLALDRREQALSVSAAGVEWWREVVGDSDSVTYNTVFAASLIGHGSVLGSLGRYRESIAATVEAVERYEIARRPDSGPATDYMISLALQNAAIASCGLGDHDTEFEYRERILVMAGRAKKGDSMRYAEAYQSAQDSMARALSQHGRATSKRPDDVAEDDSPVD